MNSSESQIILELSDFSPITLKEMDSVKLMDRKDIKYLFNTGKFFSILRDLRSNYRVLEINNKRIQHYESLYFDTESSRFYLDHHNGISNRHKVRLRKYCDSALFFLEVKYKNNKRRTRKKRIKISAEQFSRNELSQKEMAFITDVMGNDPGKLKPVLNVKYTRITLVHEGLLERVTIDVNLQYKNKKRELKLEDVVISEVKQDRKTLSSDFVKVMNKYRIFESRFSKCCFGINSLNPELKMNRFKPRNLYFHKISSKNINRIHP